MKNIVICLLAVSAGVMPLPAQTWYTGDERCPPPLDDGRYSAPYNALEHPLDYPVFADADKPGWSCSYQLENGAIVQFGDSRTPQQQWLSVWGQSDVHN